MKCENVLELIYKLHNIFVLIIQIYFCDPEHSSKIAVVSSAETEWSMIGRICDKTDNDKEKVLTAEFR